MRTLLVVVALFLSGSVNAQTNSCGGVGQVACNVAVTGTGGGTVTLGAGSAIAGKFGIDQTTPGVTNGVAVLSLPGSPAQQTGGTVGLVPGTANIGGVALGPVVTTPASTLTMTSVTTGYTAGWMIATSATGTSVTVPSFPITVLGGSAGIPWMRLYSSDTVATSWAGQTIQVDLWNTAPTFAAGHGDRAAFLAATGSSAHSATFTCVMSAIQGDGSYAECSPALGTMPVVTAAGGSTAIYWTLVALTGSGVTGASQVWTLVSKVLN